METLVELVAEAIHEARCSMFGGMPEWSAAAPAHQVAARTLARAAINTVKREKIDGLECDLYSAVQVAYRRGAIEWARLNYPDWVERLEADDADCTHPGCPLKQGQCARAGGRTEPFEDCPSRPSREVW